MIGAISSVEEQACRNMRMSPKLVPRFGVVRPFLSRGVKVTGCSGSDPVPAFFRGLPGAGMTNAHSPSFPHSQERPGHRQDAVDGNHTAGSCWTALAKHLCRPATQSRSFF